MGFDSQKNLEVLRNNGATGVIPMTQARNGVVDLIGIDHLDAGRVGRHQDHRLLSMPGFVGISLAHDDVDRAARIASAGPAGSSRCTTSSPPGSADSIRRRDSTVSWV